MASSEEYLEFVLEQLSLLDEVTSRAMMGEYLLCVRIDDIIDFHVRFERIHPFQDGNGRIGRLIMFKECLANDIVPFIIPDETKGYYYRGLSEWDREPGFLTDTILSAQDRFKNYLDYFRIPYEDR